MIDPVALTQRLVRAQSIAPADDGALDIAQEALQECGFTCHPLTFEDPGVPHAPAIKNLYAHWGAGSDTFAFAGHTDVVPAGAHDLWSVDPFAGIIRDGMLIGRGVADMKGCVAAFIAAAQRAQRHLSPDKARIALILTGDEESLALNGTVKCLDWLAARSDIPTVCLVGEPTSATTLGDALKIGRRGSLSARLTVRGIQGHAAYPKQTDNPVNRLVRWLAGLLAAPLDGGTESFEPSNIEITTIDVGNPATNVVPAKAVAGLNIRFNDTHSGASLQAWLADHAARVGGETEIEIISLYEAFLCSQDAFPDTLAKSIERITGQKPARTTGGGTSDARFIKDHCPVAEFGLPGGTIHQVDEQASVQDIILLRDTYEAMLLDYFA